MLPSTENFEITPTELQSILADDSGETIRLIDCREEDEYSFCKIEGSELIPLSRFGEEAPRKLLSGEGEPRPVIVYCHHGMRSMNATQFLRQRGLDRVWSLAGGIDLWSTQIDPDVPRY